MSARLASWSQPASPRRAVVAAALAMIVFGAAWGLLHRGFYTHSEIVDTPVYQNYGDAMIDGKVPYRDFGLEYPPAALPVFAVPSLLRSPKGDIGAYRDRFELVMVVCGELAVLFVLSALLSLEAGPGRLALGLGFAAVAPLLLGSVVLTRFDLWPAALTVGALAAFLAGRERIGAGVLGLAVAAKLYPLVLVPLAGVWVWRHSGRRGALIAGAVFLAVLLACFLPFFVLAPHGVCPELLEAAAAAGHACTALAHSRRAAQGARAHAERRGLACRVLQARDGTGPDQDDFARAGSGFGLVLLDHPAAGAALPRLLAQARDALAAGGHLWMFEGYDTLESAGARVVEHPLARLRRLLSDAGLECERISPVEADGTHVLAALARAAAASAPRAQQGGSPR